MLIKVKNHNDQILVAQKLTLFEKQTQGNITNMNRYTVSEIRQNSSADSSSNMIQKISIKNKLLNGILCDNDWYKEIDSSDETSSSVDINSLTPTITQLSKVWKKRKTGSWIWVKNRENASTSNNQNCFEAQDKNVFSVDDSTIKKLSSEGVIPWNIQHASKDWGEEHHKFKTQNKSEEGKWVNTEEICGFINKRKWNTSEEQRKQLKVFCAKKDKA